MRFKRFDSYRTKQMLLRFKEEKKTNDLKMSYTGVNFF
jgi:hypothetical protein